MLDFTLTDAFPGLALMEGGGARLMGEVTPPIEQFRVAFPLSIPLSLWTVATV